MATTLFLLYLSTYNRLRRNGMAHYRMPSNQYDNWYNMSINNMSNNFNQNNLTAVIKMN